MADMETLRGIYTAYDEQALEARREARPFDGILGLGNDPRRHPCHKQFYQSVQNWVSDFLAQGPTPEEAFEAVCLILTAADLRRNQETYWFCYAAQGLAADLIPLLTPEQSGTLAQQYDRLYPKADRLPVQKDLYKKLKRAARN